MRNYFPESDYLGNYYLGNDDSGSFKLTVPRDTSYDDIIPYISDKMHDIADKSEDIELRNPWNNNLHLINPRLFGMRFAGEDYRFKLTPHSALQLCHKAGMPKDYFYNLSCSHNYEIRNLACVNMNTLLAQYRGELLLRTVDKYVRGFLSPKYRCFDAHEILDVFTDCVGEDKIFSPSNMAIRGFCANMEVFHLRFTTTSPITTQTDNDLYYGLDLTSSDVGKYALRVRFFIYKKVCTNGLCLGVFDQNLYTQRHIYVAKDDFRQGLIYSLQSFPMLVQKATEIIEGANKVNLRGSSLLDTDARKASNTVVRDRLKKYLGLGEENMSVLAAYAVQKYDTSLWGYVNAITELAQDYSFDKRKDLEEKAGNLLTNYDRLIAV